MITAYINPELKKKSEETELSYIWRVGKLRDSGIIDMTWSELADVFNAELREPDEEFSESVYRKRYKLLKDAYEQIFSGCQPDEYLQELVIQKQEIQKEKRKLYDERLDLNKRLREQARLETTVDTLREAISNIADQYFPVDAERNPCYFFTRIIISNGTYIYNISSAAVYSDI